MARVSRKEGRLGKNGDRPSACCLLLCFMCRLVAHAFCIAEVKLAAVLTDTDHIFWSGRRHLPITSALNLLSFKTEFSSAAVKFVLHRRLLLLSFARLTSHVGRSRARRIFPLKSKATSELVDRTWVFGDWAWKTRAIANCHLLCSRLTKKLRVALNITLLLNFHGLIERRF